MQESPKFNNDPQIKKLAKDWQKNANRNEKKYYDSNESTKTVRDMKAGYFYNIKRKENAGMTGTQSIEYLHGEFIILSVIPRLLKNKPAGYKLKILDNGGGIGVLTDQIRKRFGNKVEVYSTGLSKRVARKYRKENDYPKLHKNDLKWRSIEELSDFPEFDLIIDTFGELYYKTEQYLNNVDKETLKTLYDHIEKLVKKLLPGGYATITPINTVAPGLKLEILRHITTYFNVDAHWGTGSAGSTRTLKIEKPL